MLKTDMVRWGSYKVIFLFTNSKPTSSLVIEVISHGFHSNASLLQGIGYTRCLNQGAVMSRSPLLADCAFAPPISALEAGCSEDKNGDSEDGVSCLLYCLVFREQGSTSSVWIHKKTCLLNCGVPQSVYVFIETQCYVMDLQLCFDRSDI